MKGYILFFLFVVGSLAVADEGAVGYVKIRNTNSINTVLSIKYVHYDNANDYVVLVPNEGTIYDAMVLNFNGYKNKKIISRNLAHSLQQGFSMEVSAKDLSFGSEKFLSVLTTHVSNIETLAVPDRSLAIKTCSKSLVPVMMWVARGDSNCF